MSQPIPRVLVALLVAACSDPAPADPTPDDGGAADLAQPDGRADADGVADVDLAPEADAADEPAGPAPFFAVEGTVLVDEQGRQVLLRGINVSGGNKHRDPDTGTFFPGWLGEDDWARLAEWGFNSVRLVLQWEGLEPSRGDYDEAYLEAVSSQVEAAGEAGLLVILDMHQDLWGPRYGGDGAPDWATLDDGLAFERQEQGPSTASGATAMASRRPSSRPGFTWRSISQT
jgi:hypothetical protein